MKGKKKNICFRSFLLFICILIVIQYYRGHSEEQADIDNPVIYEKEGVRFSYPGNWKISEDKGHGDIRYILIESPGNAIFSIQICPNQEAIPLQQFAEQFPEIAKQEALFTKKGNSSFSDLEKSENSGGLYGIKEDFSIKALGFQRQYYIRRYYLATNDTQTVYLISQATTEDLTKVETGFSLILQTVSLSIINSSSSSLHPKIYQY